MHSLNKQKYQIKKQMHMDQDDILDQKKRKEWREKKRRED